MGGLIRAGVLAAGALAAGLGPAAADDGAAALDVKATLSYAGTIELPRGTLDAALAFDVRMTLERDDAGLRVTCTAAARFDTATLDVTLPRQPVSVAIDAHDHQFIDLYRVRLAYLLDHGDASAGVIPCTAAIAGLGPDAGVAGVTRPGWGEAVCVGLADHAQACGEDGSVWANAAIARALVDDLDPGEGGLSLLGFGIDATRLVVPLIEADLMQAKLAKRSRHVRELMDAMTAYLKGNTAPADVVNAQIETLQGDDAAMLAYLEAVIARYAPDRDQDPTLTADQQAMMRRFLDSSEDVRTRQAAEIAREREAFATWEEEVERLEAVRAERFVRYRDSLDQTAAR